MDRVTSKALIDFGHLQHPERLAQFSFRYASFEKSLILPSGEYTCVPDFRYCDLAKPLSLGSFSLSRTLYPDVVLFDENLQEEPDDYFRLHRLVELAEQNHDPLSRRRFQRIIRRFNRIRNPYGLPTLEDILFYLATFFAKRLYRPILMLLLLFSGFSFLYAWDGAHPTQSLLYSAANTVPFFPISWHMMTLYTAPFLAPVAFIQQGLSIAVLCLYGFGIWNRFRG